jgi:hypothetical protein
MECDVNLLCYGLFTISSWFEIGNGKKCYFQYHLKIYILSQFSTIGNNLKSSNKWNIRGSWNRIIVLTN